MDRKEQGRAESRAFRPHNFFGGRGRGNLFEKTTNIFKETFLYSGQKKLRTSN
jgi:hypothetical protein